MQVDYIIVGLGLAGLAFSAELEKHGKSFVVFEDNSQCSSQVAGGMYNPVILKRFTPVWQAHEQLKIALPFYKKMEERLGNSYDFKVDIYRIFKSVEEQNNWFSACDHPKMSPYMIPSVITENFEGIVAEFGFGRLTKTGRIGTKQLIHEYHKYLREKELLIEESFDYDSLEHSEECIQYKTMKAGKIVFCEGYGIKKNPFFKQLPLMGAKGELLTIHAPNLKVAFLIKAAVFVLPIGDDLYRVGATFNWTDKSNTPTEEGKNELVTKLDSFIKSPYTIVDHIAGIRPTVKDRRPLIGIHPEYHNMAVLNGLGTRGVMIAPQAAGFLYQHLENNSLLPSEMNIERFNEH